MLLLTTLLLIKIQFGYLSKICVTQPLLTSDFESPICEAQEQEGYEQDKEEAGGLFLYTDDINPNNWTTCDIVTPNCNAQYKYRTFDGSCNNLEQPTWGMSNTAYSRILPPSYKDDKHLIRVSGNGDELPPVRKLIASFSLNEAKLDVVSLMLMQWGQLVLHDTAHTRRKDSCDCCNPLTYNEEICLAFQYSPEDYFYSKFNITCHNVFRSQYTQVGNSCGNGPAQQINSVTHALDASFIYGSNSTRANSVRAFTSGRLIMRTLEDGRTFLPNVPEDKVNSTCYVLSDKEPCYTSGDCRVNSNPQHSALSIMLQRAHNNIANKLQKIHENWNDEELYQETRRILIAILQHIHYKEWLRFYVGEAAMKKYELYPREHGHTRFNSKINLIGLNDFQAGAFRYAHAGIQGLLLMYNYDSNLNGSEPISDWLNRPLIVEKDNNYDQFLLGLVHQPMSKFDTSFSTQIRTLFVHGPNPHGVDLAGLDILRGRDHGLAPYVHYLEICTGFEATSFDDLEGLMSSESVISLKNIYKSVQDIDMFVGGSLENHVPGSRLGATFQCIFVEQFYRLKWGDRFWYEVNGQSHSFREDQLREIRKMTLSKLICDNSDNIKRMPLTSFLPVSERNKLVDCNSIADINLERF